MSAAPAEARALQRFQAFGLAVTSELALQGVAPSAAETSGPAWRLETADEVAVEAGATVIGSQRFPDGRIALAAYALEAGQVVVDAPEVGRCRLDPVGRRAVCAPEGDAAAFQRLVIGQILPFAAVLSGYEVLHASAVTIGGEGIALVGASGAGKSSIALRLVALGAGLVADDVVAVAADGEEVVAHPGAGTVNLRHAEARRLGAPEVRRVGRTVAVDEAGLCIGADRTPSPVPLRHVYLLERGHEGERVSIERMAPPDPRPLLAATFNLCLRTADRLVRHLELTARLAGRARIARLLIPADSQPEECARAIAEDVARP